MLNVGADAPQISGMNLVNQQTWSLSDYPQDIVLFFSGLTWCPHCIAQAPVLVDLWKQISTHTQLTMAIISSAGTADEPRDALIAAIKKYGIRFPVVWGREPTSGLGVPKTYCALYDVAAVPSVCVLRWDADSQRHKVQGTMAGGYTSVDGFMQFFRGLGLAADDFELPYFIGWHDRKKRALLDWLLEVPGPPRPPYAFDAALGLAMAELAGQIRDRRLREDLRRATLEVTKASVLQLLDGEREATLVEEPVQKVESATPARSAPAASRPSPPRSSGAR